MPARSKSSADVVAKLFRLVRVDAVDPEPVQKYLENTLVFGWNLFGRNAKAGLLGDVWLSSRMALLFFDRDNHQIFVRGLQKRKPVFIDSRSSQGTFGGIAPACFWNEFGVVLVVHEPQTSF